MFTKLLAPKTILFTVLGCCLASGVRAQSVISGIVNQYAAVTALDTCNNRVVVADPAGFRAGEQALLIQMQGATMNTDNSPDFGNIVDLGGAGLFEKVIIRSIAANQITLENQILNRYDINGAVQLVSLPVFDRVVIEATLEAKAWDGATGGVIALEVTDTLVLEADIDAGGAGFRGGQANIQEEGECSFVNSIRTFGLPLGDFFGAAKGEGIAKWITGLEAARGPQVNGGGGGNDHNSGGGGGANVSGGGRGGRNAEPSFFGCDGAFPGDGGNPAPADTARLYMGGGGGAGDENNNVATSGGNGGGIVVLSAKVLVGNGFSIRSNGQDVSTTTGDGAGGGGAGGSILLQGETLLGALTIEATGGQGGDIDNRNQLPARCHGPGGGGGGGRYLGPAAWTPTLDLSGGAAGVSFNSPDPDCGNSANLALPGETGLQQVKNGIPESTVPFALPSISGPADNTPACEGAAWETSVQVEGGLGPQFRWQVRQGNAFTDLSAAPPYSGVNTTNLRIDPVSRDLDENLYRLRVVTACGEELFSAPVGLSVDELPAAAFSFAQNDLDVTFNNQSGGASSYTWFFGDGAQSEEINPGHTYEGNGDYEVMLIARNACGADTLRQTVSLNMGMAPRAAFSFEPSSGCGPLQIRFTNESTGDYTEIEWRFLGGEPAVSTEENPVVTYTESGLYTFALVVTGPLGQDLLLVEEQIEVRKAPIAGFSFAVSDRTVSFENTSIEGESYRWLLGDGEEDTERNPVHTYAGPGDYEVTLIVANECGADTSMMMLSIGVAPQAGFSFSPSSGCTPLQIQFANESTGDYTELRWRFPGGQPAVSTDPEPVVTYAQSGTYTFSLTVSGILGQDSLVVEQELEVSTPPLADFTFTTDDRTVYFQNQSVGAEIYTWILGDGQDDSAVDPKYTYDEYGNYEVALIAINGCGRDTIFKTVILGAAPRARYTVAPAGGCAPVEVQFSNQSAGNFDRIEWQFPGGVPAASSEPNPVIRYETPGTYGVRLFLEGPLGADQIEVEDAVEILPVPEPAFTYELRGDTLFLQNQSANGLAYRWNFGDGSTSREENPVHVYERSGVFDVTLNATNPYCGKSIAQRINVVITSDEEALRAAGIRLYPNPFSDLLYVDISDYRVCPLRITLFNSSGQQLERRTLQASGPLWLAPYPAGGYYLWLESDRGAWMSRVVKR